MSVTHATFAIERRFGCTPRETFSVFSEPELRRRWVAKGAFLGVPEDAAIREHGTGKLLDALGRFLAGEPVR